jgi:hypothetical protein
VNGSARAPAERVSVRRARRHEIRVIVLVQKSKGCEKLQKLPRRKQLPETKIIAATTLTHVRRPNRQLSICSFVHRSNATKTANCPMRNAPICYDAPATSAVARATFVTYNSASQGLRDNATIASCIANEPFRGQFASKLGWYSRVCGQMPTISNVGSNKSVNF